MILEKPQSGGAEAEQAFQLLHVDLFSMLFRGRRAKVPSPSAWALLCAASARQRYVGASSLGTLTMARDEKKMKIIRGQGDTFGQSMATVSAPSKFGRQKKTVLY